MELDGQVALVTGASRGIGKAIAIELARAGAKVALLGRSADLVQSVTREIVASGAAARGFAADVRELASIEAVVEEIERDLGGLTLLVNNAASFRAIGPIWTVDPSEWWQDVEINLKGPFTCSRAALPRMVFRGAGRIINLVGGGTASSFPNGSGYAASKAGLMRFTECVSDTLAGTGILMFALDPGLVHTAMTDYQLESRPGRIYLPGIQQLFDRGINVPPDLAGQLVVAIATGRFDALAGRMLMAARGDLGLNDADMAKIVAQDWRSLRVNGMPMEGDGGTTLGELD